MKIRVTYDDIEEHTVSEKDLTVFGRDKDSAVNRAIAALFSLEETTKVTVATSYPAEITYERVGE